jgi:nitric oxide reductase subunit B
MSGWNLVLGSWFLGFPFAANNPFRGIAMTDNSRRPMVISRLWLQGVVLTFIFGFAVLGYLALGVYQDHAPVPERVVSDTGQTVFTGEDILLGQQVFLTYGLMEYGSVFGHGAYLGPDFTADYLHRQALEIQQFYGGGAEAQERLLRELQDNHYDSKTDTLTWTDGQVRAFEALRQHYQDEILNRRRSGAGMGPGAVPDPEEIRRITAFVAWTAWTASACRPGRPYSYTNNWPPEPGNQLTEEAVVWSTLSIIALLGGIGLMLTAFGRYSHLLGWHAQEERRLRFFPPTPLGRPVPGRGRLLELPGSGCVRLPHQPARRQLLRDRHPVDGQPRPRRHDGCF